MPNTPDPVPPAPVAATAESVQEALVHIRLIHFAATVVAATAVLLAYTSWNPAVEIEEGLSRIRAFTSALTARPPCTFPEDLVNCAGPELTNRLSNLLREARIITDRRCSLLEPAKLVTVTGIASPIQPFDTNSLAGTAQSISSTRFAVTAPASFRLVEASALDYLQKWVGKYAADSNSVLLVAIQVTNSSVSGALTRRGTLQLHYGVWIPDQKSHFPGASPVTFPILTGSYITQGASSELTVLVSFTNTVCTLHPDWLAQAFPPIWEDWEHLKPMRGGEALKSAREQRLGTIKGTQVDVLGVQVRSEHLGLAGPFLVFSALLYLLAYVNDLLRLPPPTQPFPIAWIGAMTSFSARAATFVTLIPLPAAAIYLCLWRLLGYQKLALGLATCAGLLGYCLYGSATQLSKSLTAQRQAAKPATPVA